MPDPESLAGQHLRLYALERLNLEARLGALETHVSALAREVEQLHQATGSMAQRMGDLRGHVDAHGVLVRQWEAFFRQAVERPRVPVPRLTWDNLWKAFTWVPGTGYPRIMLTLWEVLLGLVCWGGGAWWGWWGLLALPVAFVLHEVAFTMWVTHVARIPAADDGDVVGVSPKAVVTLERWVGPVR